MLHLDLVMKHMLLRNIYIRIINHAIFYVCSKDDISCNSNIAYCVVTFIPLLRTHISTHARTHAYTQHAGRYYIGTFSTVPPLSTKHRRFATLFLRFNYRKSLGRFFIRRRYDIRATTTTTTTLCVSSTPRERVRDHRVFRPRACPHASPSPLTLLTRARSAAMCRKGGRAEAGNASERDRRLDRGKE